MTDEAKALVERLRGDWPEILVEKHWMMDSDAIDKQREEAADLAIDKQREEAADLIETQAREIERLREALQSVINACDQGKLAPLGGPCGMTIEAQIRGSVYNRVPAWPVEEARAALAGDSHE